MGSIFDEPQGQPQGQPQTPTFVQGRQGQESGSFGAQGQDQGLPGAAPVAHDQVKPQSGRLSEEEAAQLKALRERESAQKNEDSKPTEENFTHYVHLADGTVEKARGSATVWSRMERDDDGNEKEVLVPITGVHAR